MALTYAYASSTRAGRTYSKLKSIEHRVLVYAVREGNSPMTQSDFHGLMKSEPEWFTSWHVRDDWGTLLNFKQPSSADSRAFDLYSSGPNRLDEGGEGDDVVPWEYRGYYSSSKQPFEILLALGLLLDAPAILLFLFGRHFIRRVKPN